jgi:hypothetical protein
MGAAGYQLVLQFRAASLGDYDAMVALEAQLIGALGDTATVDGHDFGSSETNIFILASDPCATLQRIRPLLKRTNRLREVTVAYREINGARYTVIWPEGSQVQFRVA